MMKKIFLIFTFLFLSAGTAQARIYIPVDQPSDLLFPIVICNAQGAGGFGEDIANVIRNDLKLSGYFSVMNAEVFQKQCASDGGTLETTSFSYWAGAATQALVAGTITKAGGTFTVQLRLFDPYTPQLLLEKEYTAKNNEMRKIAHHFVDEIMEVLTGIRGIFNTSIAYTSASSKNNKEIMVADVDGENNRKITSFRSISLAPAWSPSGKEIVFSSYKNGGPDLYLIDTNGKTQRLTQGRGANITPKWSPTGSSIIFASTVSGEADLYALTPQGKSIRSLTSMVGIDLAPTFSPDGSEIIFASERAGKLHLFRMLASGGPATRLTFVGYQNDMPAWSPRGDKVAFSGRDMGTFDIFIMNPDGSNIQRLTSGAGSNEHPSFSPDGRFIVFSSTRAGGPSIYMMRVDGSNQSRISKGYGILPAWGPRQD